jgi:SAM-dependent methyltransferase
LSWLLGGIIAQSAIIAARSEHHMTTESAQSRGYVLGHDSDELARLDRQAASIADATRLLLQVAGVGKGMRVLDLGTGLGHVARMAGELVGSDGAVVGVDRSSDALAVARQRAHDAHQSHVSFVEGDVATWRAAEPFDAVVGRLILFHLADPATIVRHHLEHLRPGGLFLAVDFDLGGCRAEPFVQLAQDAVHWVERAFSAAGASPRIGASLGTILRRVGLDDVKTLGIQAYLQPDNPMAAGLLGGVVRSLAPVILQRGIATAEQVDVQTIDARIARELQRANAVLLPPTVVGAWGRTTTT